jgi:hypothetical protein
VTYPPLEEPSQQRRAIVYGRANQASAHYRPLRKGRPQADPAFPPDTTSRPAKVANRRRFLLFAVALLVAIAAGTAIFGVVFASPAPVAQAPNPPAREVPAPEPAIQPMPPTGRGSPVEQPPPGATRTGDDPAPPKTTTKNPGSGAAGEATKAAAPATSATVYFQNCNKARRAGAAPLHSGDPGYSTKLDKDGNGIACDEKEKDKDKG